MICYRTVYANPTKVCVEYLVNQPNNITICKRDKDQLDGCNIHRLTTLKAAAIDNLSK